MGDDSRKTSTSSSAWSPLNPLEHVPLTQRVSQSIVPLLTLLFDVVHQDLLVVARGNNASVLVIELDREDVAQMRGVQRHRASIRFVEERLGHVPNENTFVVAA